MKKIFRLVSAVVSGLCFLFLFSNLSYAAEGNVGYDIQAVIPDNQVNTENSYFDLRMKPGQKQTITLLINNTSDEKSIYEVSVNQGYTNKQGFIDYANPDEGKNNKYPYELSDIAKVDSPVTVEKNSSIEVPITLTMPEKSFDGQILGAIQVVKNTEAESGISNSYGYLLGLKLTETDTEVKRDLLLEKVEPAVSFGTTSVVAVLENPTMDAYGHLKYDAVVTNAKTKEEVRKISYDNDMQMAPNSYYRFAIDWDNKRLEAGEYKLHLEVKDAKDNVWTFDKNFTITRDQAKEVNDVTIDAAKQNDIPTWVFILIGVLLAVILLAIFWIILMKRRKKDEEENQ